MYRKLAAIVCLAVAIVVACYWPDGFDEESIRGKRVLVTGASSGIGEQTSYQYAKLGAKVVVTARTVKKLEKVVAKCKLLSGMNDHYFVAADMANLTETGRVIREATTLLGGLDIIVLNHVGPYRFGWWQGKENLTAFNSRTTISYLSHVHLASHALPVLRKSTRSNIVVITSLAAKVGFGVQADYAGAKFALDGFFRSLQQQFYITKEDVAVTICFLGPISTESLESATTVASLSTLYSRSWLVTPCPEDTGYAIMRAAALRKKQLYHPYFVIKIAELPILGDLLLWFLQYHYAEMPMG